MKSNQTISLYAVGDVCVDREDPASVFAHTASVTSEADIAFCQLETMYSERRSAPSIVANVPLCAHPRNISALKLAGFDVVSLAGNHVLDFGWPALEDTINFLEKEDIRTVGAGKDISQARKPVIIERKGIRTAFLAYSSILPQRYWAETDKPGCAPLRVTTVYEPVEQGQPGVPAKVLTFPDPSDLAALKEDVRRAKQSADVVVLSLHWGVHFIPAVLATYQREVAHQAIDAGVDLIVGTHAHILKPIEVYKGKVITYSLCNFAFDIHLTAEDFQLPKRKEIRKYYPNRMFYDDYPTYSFPVEARKTILLKCAISRDGIQRVSFLPVFINPTGQPEVLRRDDPRSGGVVDYMKELCKDFGTGLTVEGDEVVIHTN